MQHQAVEYLRHDRVSSSGVLEVLRIHFLLRHAPDFQSWRFIGSLLILEDCNQKLILVLLIGEEVLVYFVEERDVAIELS